MTQRRLTRRPGHRLLRHRLPGHLFWVAHRTVTAAWADRVLGLAAEAAFWSALSFAPLLLTLVGLVGFAGPLIGEETLGWVQRNTLAAAELFLAPSAADGLESVVVQVLRRGHSGVATIGFVIALWAGSTAMSSYVNAITIAYGMRDVRSAVRARLLGLTLYAGGVVAGMVIVPLLVVGPDWARAALPATVDTFVDGLLDMVLRYGYWPGLLGLSAAAVTVLYHVAAPVAAGWSRDLPGAVLAVTVWLGGSVALRGILEFSFARSPVYAAVATPVAGLLFLYVVALAVLVGAELNAAIDQLDPDPATAAARRAATEIQMRRLARKTQPRTRPADPHGGSGPPDRPKGRNEPCAGSGNGR